MEEMFNLFKFIFLDLVPTISTNLQNIKFVNIINLSKIDIFMNLLIAVSGIYITHIIATKRENAICVKKYK